jgi:hypothetical protein
MAQRTTTNLKPAALNDAQTQLATLMGDALFAALDDRERRYLAKTLRIRFDLDCLEDVPVQLGRAVERSLKQHLLKPLGDAVLHGRLVLPHQDDRNRFHTRVCRSLAGEEARLGLGELLGVFGAAVTRLADAPRHADDVFMLLAEQLRALPNPAALYADDAVWQQRTKALQRLTNRRN